MYKLKLLPKRELPGDPCSTAATESITDLPPYIEKLAGRQGRSLDSVATHYDKKTFKDHKTDRPSSRSQRHLKEFLTELNVVAESLKYRHPAEVSAIHHFEFTYLKPAYFHHYILLSFKQLCRIGNIKNASR